MGIVVDDLDEAVAFFEILGMELEGRGMVEGEWADRITGLGDQQIEIAMLRTPHGHGRLEMSRFLSPAVVSDHREAPVNALGYLRVMFPSTTSTRHSAGSPRSAGSSSATSSTSRTSIASVTSAAPVAPDRPRRGTGLSHRPETREAALACGRSHGPEPVRFGVSNGT